MTMRPLLITGLLAILALPAFSDTSSAQGISAMDELLGGMSAMDDERALLASNVPVVLDDAPVTPADLRAALQAAEYVDEPVISPPPAHPATKTRNGRPLLTWDGRRF